MGDGTEGGKGGEGGNRDGKIGSNWGATFDAERAKRCFQKIQKHHLYHLQPDQLARRSELRRVSKPPLQVLVSAEKKKGGEGGEGGRRQPMAPRMALTSLRPNVKRAFGELLGTGSAQGHARLSRRHPDTYLYTTKMAGTCLTPGCLPMKSPKNATNFLSQTARMISSCAMANPLFCASPANL